MRFPRWFRTGFPQETDKEKYLKLWERVETVEREMKNVRLDWENAYDRLHTMMARTAKRAAKMHDQAEDEGLLAPGGEKIVYSPQDQIILNRLGPAQRRIQEQLLAKRRAANGGGG